MKIDAHQHFLDSTRFQYPWITEQMGTLLGAHGIEQLVPELQSNGVAATVVVQTLSSTEETIELLRLAEEHDVVAGVVGWVDLTARDVGAALDRLLDSPGGEFLKGIRHGVADEADPNWIARSDVSSGLAEVSRRGLTFDLEIGVREAHAAAHVVAKHADLPFVIDHLGKPLIAPEVDPRWLDSMRELAALPNTTAKISGLVTEADWNNWKASDFVPFVEVAFDLFGARRLMFGSDWPVCLLAATYSQVASTATHLVQSLSRFEEQQVFERTAANFYKLTPSDIDQKD
ncbi:amidohydrolase family protein [Agreia bicolorata]|uniref:Amidohydrolase-related domain-containing protein n=1 Tax=Agreia bicolorata TaxID=110935 RepID=A0ABR5CDG6_9MICO|nr:amidohydrolase family protein [Agreia bicolorata]KJC63632.1 hypothetical protein TZ00_13995 [Agreia bicolorata]